MGDVSRILVCRCSRAQILPAGVAEKALGRLQQAAVDYEAVDDLCELAARRDPALRGLVATGRLKVAACFPRAIKALFAAAGAPLDESKTEILNLRTETVEEVSRALLGPELVANVPSRSAEHLESFSPLRAPEETGRRKIASRWDAWFPVIDFDRCNHCLQCLNFCLFGVYGVADGGHVQVQHPENCKPNCPACARVCPETAILFPKYKTGPISGAIEGESDASWAKPDISAMLGGDLYSKLRERRLCAKRRFSPDPDPVEALRARQEFLVRLVESGDIPQSVLAELERAVGPRMSPSALVKSLAKGPSPAGD